MGVKAIGGDLQRFNLHLALTMECLHSGAIRLCAHLEFVITTKQNNDCYKWQCPQGMAYNEENTMRFLDVCVYSDFKKLRIV
jgi:hypothetical protein